MTKTKQSICEWSRIEEDCDSFSTSCGNAFEFNDGGPKENKAKYCLYCGRLIHVIKER